MLDVAPWDRMLRTYVDDQGRVDYRRWQPALADLERWLGSLQTLDMDSLSPDAALATWINLYNALTIRQVLRVYPIPSILPRWWGLPNYLGLLRFFSRPIYPLGGTALSLNTIEHQRLRRHYQEPRIHFALVCASVGCPWLRNGAYHADIIDAQLETDAQQFITNPAKVRYDPATHTLYCSKIFRWYRQDFLHNAPARPEDSRAEDSRANEPGANQSVADYIAPYLPTPLPPKPQLVYLPYDWSLNQRPAEG